ncbi:MAG: beta strand repeat-containing protein [Sphingobium sp.]
MLDNDSDPDGDPLSVTQFVVNGETHAPGETASIPGVGTIVIQADGSYVFTPVADWNGTVPTVTYTVSDGNDGGSRSSTLDIKVTPVVDIAPDAIVTHAGDPVVTPVLDNDSFENGDAEISSVTQGGHGTVVANPDGTITYTPEPGYVGPDSYSYTVTSGGVTETTTVTVTVENAPPAPLPEQESTPEDTPLLGNVLDNDSDPDGDPLSVTQFVVNGETHAPGETASIPGVGTIVIQADGSYVFTPVADWNGTVPTVTYTVSDGNDGGSRSSTLDIKVTPVVDIAPDAIVTHAGDPVVTPVLDNDSFENGDAEISSVTQGGHGTVVANPDGTITYTPEPGYVGPDSYSYTVTSGGVTETTTVTVTVENAPPAPLPEQESTPEDTPLLGNVLDNDSDPDGDPLSVTQFVVNGETHAPGETASIPGVGTIVIQADGSYVFTPVADWNGTVPTVTYTVSDGNDGGSRSSTLDIEVTPVEDAPRTVGTLADQADEDAGTVTSVDVSGGFTDVDLGDSLSYSATGLPAGLTIDPVTGVISGTIDNSASQSGTTGNPAGSYTVVVTATDESGASVTQQFDWTVTNPAPEALPDMNSVTEDGADLVVSAADGVIQSGGNAASADSDPDGDALIVTHVAASGDGFPATANAGTQVTGLYGTLTLNADGSYSYALDPDNPVVNALNDDSAPLTDVFDYRISDGEGGTASTTLTITINGHTDGAPTIAPVDTNGTADGQATVYESGLTTDGDPGESASASGSIAISAADGLTSVTIGGTILTLAQLNALSPSSPVTIVTPQGQLVLTGYSSSGDVSGVSTGGSLSYSYTLLNGVTNTPAAPDSVMENIALTVTDAGGGSSTGTLGITIIDDAPSVNGASSASVSEVNLAGGTSPDSAALTVTGTLDTRIGADATDFDTRFDPAQSAPAGLTSGGVAVVYEISADGHTLTARAGTGGPVVFTVTITDPTLADAGYSFQLSGVLDHAADADLDLDFAFLVADGDGDSDDGSFTVTVVDDGPTAVNDAAVTLEEGGEQAGTAFGADNLIANDAQGADGDAKITSITYTDEAGASITVAVPDDATGVTVDTRYGTLTVKSDGSWNYVSDATEDNLAGVSDNFSYELKDGDGSTSTASQPLTVTDTDPAVADAVITVDEGDIPGTGSHDPKASNSATVDLDITPGHDAISDVQFDAATISDLQGQGLTSGGTALVYDVSADGHTLTARAGAGGAVIFTLALNNPTDPDGTDQSVTMTLLGALDHGAGQDSLAIAVDYAVQDTDSAVRGGMTLTVVDDAPVAVAGSDEVVTEGGQSVSGTLLLANDAEGADGARVYQVEYVNDAGATVVGTVAAGAAGSTFDTIYGSLTVHQDGSWSYTSDAVVDHPKATDDMSINDPFRYNLIDGDGDVSNWATQVVTVNDTVPTIGTPDAVSVDEAHLARGTDPDAAQLTQTGSLAVTRGADAIDVTFDTAQPGLAGLTSGGTALVYELSADGYILTARAGTGGPIIFTATITDPTSNSAGYAFELSGALDNGGASLDLDFAFTVTDGDNDTAGSSFTVTVVDDEPQTAQTLTVAEDSISGTTIFSSADGTSANMVVSSDPAHGTVTINADGTVTYVPTGNYSGGDSFTYTTTADDGTSVSTVVTVTVTPISDAPGLTADAGAVQTNEDEAIALGLNAPVVTDAVDQNGGAVAGDNPELLGAIVLTGIPAGAVLTSVAGMAPIVSTGDPIMIELTNGTHIAGLTGTVQMTVEQFEALQVTPPAESHGNFTVNVSVTSYEVDDAGTPLVGVPGATTSTTVQVNVQAVTDPVDLSLVDGDDADALASDHSITEDTSFDLADLLSVSFPDADGNGGADLDGSEERWFEISGLPVGSVVNGVTVTAENPVVTVAAPALSTSAGGIPSMTVTPPADFSGDIAVTVTVKAQDQDSDGIGAGATTGVVEQDSVILNLHVNPQAGDVTATGVTTPEDTPVSFLSGLTVTDDHDGTEVITAVSFDVPAGWTLVTPGASPDYSISASGNSYTITFGSSMTESAREAVLADFVLTPPAHSSADATIDVTVTTEDSSIVNGSTVTASDTRTLPVKVTVTAVAEVVGGDSDGDGNADLTMTDGHSYGATGGQEDAWFTLGTEGAFNLSSGWSDQDGDETLYARLTPVLVIGDGGVDSASGSQFRYSSDGGGTWTTVTYGGSPVNIPLAHLDTLQFKAPADQSGQFRIDVSAYVVDRDSDTGSANTAISGSAVLDNIVIAPVADDVTLTLRARVSGVEDQEIPLDIRPTSSDPSESFNVTIDGVPDGAQIIYNGSTLTVANNSVTISGFDSSLPLNIVPPLNSNEDFTLTVSAVSVDGTNVSTTPTSLTIDVSLKGVADVVDLTPVSKTYVEASLDEGSDHVMLADLVNVAMYDTDGSEALTLRISGLAEGFGLSHGTLLVNGTGAERVWVLTADQYALAEVKVPANFSGTASFSVSAVSTENDGSSLTGAPVSVGFAVTPSPEATVTQSATLVEDQITSLGFSILHQNGDTDEVLSTVWIKVSDAVTAGYELYLGTDPLASAGLTTQDIGGVTYYVISGANAGQLAARGASNMDGPLGSFDFKYEIVDDSFGSTPSGASESVIKDGTFVLSASPVTDAVDISIIGITGTAPDTAIDDVLPGDDATPDTAVLQQPDNIMVMLNVATVPDAQSQSGTADTDGSEQVVRIVIDGVPDGVSIEGADYSGAGSWLLIYDGTDTLPINAAGGIEVPIIFHVSQNANGITDAPITIEVQTQDRAQEGADTAIQSDRVTWHLTTTFPEAPGVIPATIDQWQYNGEGAGEDSAFQLADIIDAGVTINDPSVDNVFTVTVVDLPPGTIVQGMYQTMVDGQLVWSASVTVSPGGSADLALQSLMESIVITPPANSNENNNPDGFYLDATLTTYVPGGLSETAAINDQVVPVAPVTDPATIAINVPAIDEGTGEMPVTITLGSGPDGAFGQIVDGKLYVKVNEVGSTNGLHEGTLTYNGVEPPTEMVGGSLYYVIEPVSAGTSVDLVYTPNNSTAGEVSFTAMAVSQESGSVVQETAIADAVGVVNRVDNGVIVTSAPSAGVEGAPVQLEGLSVALIDDDGSETVTTLLLTDVPNGFLVLIGADAASAVLASNAGGDGNTNSWVISNADGSLPGYVAVVPPDHWSGTLSGLNLAVESGEAILNDTRIDSFALDDVVIAPQADGVNLTATNTFGYENTVVSFNLNASMVDPSDASLPAAPDENQETATVKITGLGAYASIYVGSTALDTVTYDPDTDSYTVTGLSQSDLDALGFMQARNALVDQDAGQEGVQLHVEIFTEDGASQSSSVSDYVTVNSFAQSATNGADTLLWTGQAINARGGADTIMLRHEENLTGDVLDNLLNNVEVLSMNGNDITNLTAADVLGIAGSSTLSLLGDGSDHVSLGAGWSAAGGPVMNGGIEYVVYTAMVNTTTVELRVESSIMVD